MITAGAASNKISELRSKLAIYQAWIDTIHNNYMPSDGAKAEATIERDDGMPCTEEHFTSVIVDIQEKINEVREELVQWEGLVFEAPQAQVTPITERPLESKGRSKFGARRVQPATKHS